MSVQEQILYNHIPVTEIGNSIPESEIEKRKLAGLHPRNENDLEYMRQGRVCNNWRK